MNQHLAIKMPCFSTIAPALGRFESVVGRALPAFTINVDGISVGSAHPAKLTQAVHPRLDQRFLKIQYGLLSLKSILKSEDEQKNIK